MQIAQKRNRVIFTCTVTKTLTFNCLNLLFQLQAVNSEIFKTES